MSWFILALIAMLCWSGSDLFSKMGSKPDDKLSHWKMVMAVGLVIGSPFVGFFFIAPAIIASINGIIYSAIGHHRVCERAFHGGAFSVAGLVIGSSMLSLSLGALVQLILTVIR